MREVVFVDFARTAFCERGGALKTFSGAELGAACLKGLLQKSGILERGGERAVDAVFGGSSFHSKETYAPFRYLTVLAGLPVETEAHQVEMQSASAIASINHAAFQIALGYADVVIAGGMESHSTRPVFMSTTTDPYKGLTPAWLEMRNSPIDGQNVTLPEVSDLMAQKWGITRAQCDEFALRSHQRACRSGFAAGEIVPVTVPGGRKSPDVIVEKDESPKALLTPEELGALQPICTGGVSTAGNVAGFHDGAGFVLMMTAERAAELGFVPYARWIMGADAGTEPRYMGIASAFASVKALQLAGLTVSEVNVWECTEVSAAQNLAVIRELEKQSGMTLDQSGWNPNGGAIALGHPNGASGARGAMAAMQELEKSGGRYGVISSCGGGGHGSSVIIENLRR